MILTSARSVLPCAAMSSSRPARTCGLKHVFSFFKTRLVTFQNTSFPFSKRETKENGCFSLSNPFSTCSRESWKTAVFSNKTAVFPFPEKNFCRLHSKSSEMSRFTTARNRFTTARRRRARPTIIVIIIIVARQPAQRRRARSTPPAPVRARPRSRSGRLHRAPRRRLVRSVQRRPN